MRSDDGRIIFEGGMIRSAIPGVYTHCKYVSFGRAATGGTPTFVPCSATSVGGLNLDSPTEYVYWTSLICPDWDGTSNLYMAIIWETDENNTGGAVDDVVEIELEVYYKGMLETACKHQSLNNITVIGQAPQYKQYRSIFTIDYLEVGNNVDPRDLLGIRLRFDTDNSDITDIIVNHGVLVYTCSVPQIESWSTGLF